MDENAYFIKHYNTHIMTKFLPYSLSGRLQRLRTGAAQTVQARIQDFRIWLSANWFRLLIIGALLVIFLKKDITLQLSLKNGHPWPATALSRPTAESRDAVRPVKISMQGETPLEAALEVQRAYVERFAEVAQAEMRKYGIPASIKLGQALLETNAGASPLARRNNNHFGIKCFSKNCRKGHCSNFSDDSHKDFFRKYDSAWESFRSHSQLMQGERYAHLFKLGKNYRAWARGLQEAGYATDTRYAEKLIGVIEALGLQRYDGG
jgi:hypothetical protein